MGHYIGTEVTTSDHGPIEAAYLQAVAAFAADAGVERLAIREPEATGFVHFGAEPAVPGHGLAEIFPPDLTGYHDGAEITVDVALELVRAMLRDNGAWCRLEAEGAFAVHVGWDQYVYVRTSSPSTDAMARTRALGLFPERLDASAYDHATDEDDIEQRPADDDFWARLRWSVAIGQATILEEGFVLNASRWHRLTKDNLDDVRARLAPRAMLTVWPDLSTDVEAVIADLPDEGLVEFVWEDENGQITSTIADEAQFSDVTEQIRGARAATALPMYADDRHPLFTAVLPDSDGVLRARWRTEPTESDRRWAVMKALRRGQVCTGTVTAIPPFLVTFVDIGGVIGQINVPELSWRHIEHPTDVVSVGQEITVKILDVDMVRERVALSLRAAGRNPLEALVDRVGEIVTGHVTKVLPFGVIVRIEERHDDVEALVRHCANEGQHLTVGDTLTVKILDVDPSQRRITLAHTPTSDSEGDGPDAS
ncbi:S1 RNA-binding domain-containing protein [Glycomyces sp. YM15]|uniref:S1 RNA-binding domain-containing protein n=1 Tax=Glycomyces sp. YM15 TaxID=2800446 RepID=UPI00196415CF|nr:S1 RNA-binding domain-containing protein [Glycomyces sp. YM15]